MPSFDIEGTPVVFPFKPYDCQLTYIRGVVTALNESKNALLESPTGTGKTLCLLCASLAWQQKNASAMESQPPPPPATELAYEQTVTDLSRPRQPQQNRTAGVSGQPALPSVVIYASRTHSQLSQVAGELKNTVYRPRLSLLGSRDQLCVHEEVSQMKGPAKNHACQALVGARRCKFHRGTESFEQAGDAGVAAGMNSRGGKRGPSEQNTVSDIEELVSLAKKREFCPYYLGRAQAPRAELVLMPYNYLLDAGTRRGIKLNWSNSVVIFDEAHNLENVASEAASFELTSAQVAGAQEEALRCHKIFSEGGGADQEVGSAAQADDALVVKQALHLLEDAMEGVELPSCSGGSSSSGRGVTRAGEFIYALFGHAGVTFDTASLWLRKLQDMSDTLQENALYGQANALKLDAVARAIKVAFRGGNASKADCLAFSQMYRAHVAPAETVMASSNGGDRRGRGSVGIGGGRRAGGGAGRILCFWCFCPGVAMEDLRALGVRSIIITSGTLSPLSSFANELRLPFEVQVENPHVIGPEQAWIGTLGRGVTNVALNSSYANRDNDRYKDELGATLANLCRIVPGGMLVFFSTYRAMNDCVQRWKHYDNGKTWSRISAHKEPVLEPRTAADLKAVMEEYDARIESTGGAVFLAVCRGKVSEGMDFSDGRARCVVVTGIPYAPAMDAKVILKKKYMSEAPLPPGVQRVTGQEWYQQQASRAVNQAIGRVIRHRRDFGCVVLCDSRFAEERNRQSLSLWARPFVRECSGFGRVAADLTRFFKACAANPNLKHADTITAAPSGPTRLQSQLQPSHVRLAAAAGARGALTSGMASSRGLKGVGAVKDGEEGNDFLRETTDLASKQDVGDIVDSLGGRRRRLGSGGSGSGGESRGGSGPLGLLQALKASASFVGSAGGGEEAEEPSESGCGVVKLNVGGRRVGNGVGGSSSSSNSSELRGGKGWESVPLSQRLAKVGAKSASTGISASGVGGGARPKKQSPGRANSNKNLSGRATGLGGGVIGVAGRSGAGGGTGAEGGDTFGLFSSSNDSKHGGDDGSKELLSNNNARRGTTPFSSETRDAVEIPKKGGSGRGHQQNDAVLDPQGTIITSTISPEQGSTVLPRGGGGSGAQNGSIRRQRLEAFLSDLRKGISRGAYDVFRSRAKAMKEGALDAAETALPALKGVLEVLLLAPPELMLPRRFAQHIPEEHENIYAALLAKKSAGGKMDQIALGKTTASNAEKGDAKKAHKRVEGQGVGGTRTAGQHPSGKVRRITASAGVGSGGGRAGVITSTEKSSTGRGGKPYCEGKKLVVAAGAVSIRGGKFSVRSPSQSSPLPGAATGGADSISSGEAGVGGSSKRARFMAGGGTADRTSAAAATAAAGVGGGHGVGRGSSDTSRRAVAQLLAVAAPSSDGNDGRNRAAVGRHRNSTRRSIPPP